MIVTIGREFGSGGRELGKRLADALGIPCYDKEIIREVAKMKGISPESVEHISETDIRTVYTNTIGRSIISPVYCNNTAIEVLSAEELVIKNLATEDCVIVGRAADVILADKKPLNLFVYADKEARLRRCLAHIKPGETQKSLLKHIKKIDRTRAANRRILCDSEWGKRETYHLCINTSNVEIKTLVPALAEYVKLWFLAQTN